MCTRLADLEQATRDQIASNAQIKRWIGDGFLSLDQASEAFPGLADTAARDPGPSATEYRAILEAYDNYALVHSMAHYPHRKTPLNNMSMSRHVLEWLCSTFPDRSPTTFKDC